jgi:hypothetical protein
MKNKNEKKIKNEKEYIDINLVYNKRMRLRIGEYSIENSYRSDV